MPTTKTPQKIDQIDLLRTQFSVIDNEMKKALARNDMPLLYRLFQFEKGLRRESETLMAVEIAKRAGRSR